MKEYIKKIMYILTPSEKRKFFRLTASVFVVNLLDIFFLACLLFIINIYTSPGKATTPEWMPAWFFSKNNIALILVFFLLFSIKNVIAYSIFRAQYAFSYAIASGVSSNLLLNYLEGNFSGYVHTDSSVHIRKISQQPVEFSQYILAGFQQIISESILILFSAIAILLYNPKLFALLFVVMLPAY
jgi:ABC-type multidrug transport system fused ATPase/permease subunit